MDTDIRNIAISSAKFVLAAVVVAVGWLWLCRGLGWNPLGWGGITLGLVTGTALCLANRSVRGFSAGVCGALVAGAAIGLSSDGMLHARQVLTKEERVNDDAMILAFAEQIMASQSTRQALEDGTSPAITFGAPIVRSRADVSDRVWKAATAQWNAVPEATKQKMRQQRTQFSEQTGDASSGGSIADIRRMIKIAVMLLAGVMALAIGSAPAWLDRTREAFA